MPVKLYKTDYINEKQLIIIMRKRTYVLRLQSKFSRFKQQKMFLFYLASLFSEIHANCVSQGAQEKCQADCKEKYTFCIIQCGADIDCSIECSRDYVDCEDFCPCGEKCPNGCPCPTDSDFCGKECEDVFVGDYWQEWYFEFSQLFRNKSKSK